LNEVWCFIRCPLCVSQLRQDGKNRGDITFMTKVDLQFHVVLRWVGENCEVPFEYAKNMLNDVVCTSVCQGNVRSPKPS
jgi:hypothetical protein